MPAVVTASRWYLPNAIRAKSAVPPAPSIAWQVPAVVFLVALTLAVYLYSQFLDVHRYLWIEPLHDRNAHYLFALKLATDLGNGRFLRFLADLNDARVWPPLHGLLAAAALSIGGFDYRWAVLPNLGAWVLTVLFGFLLARRGAERGGTFAGAMAALFIAASPAHRAYASDIMLEGLGAALSLAALYFYSRAEQGGRGVARCLALVLTALFLEKYNYWLLIVLALLAAEHSGAATVRERFCVRSLTVAARFLHHPLLWAGGVVLVLSGGVFLYGDRPFRFAGHTLSLYPPHNLIHIAYVLLFLRLLAWWRQGGRLWARQLDERWRQIVHWHIWPLSVWFLLPKRPSFFLWYLSFGNRTPEQRMDPIEACRDYAGWLVHDYHFNLPSALVALGLCAAAFLTWRRLRPGGRAVLALVALGAALTLLHPNHKGRMLHSWIAAVWIAAGLGASALVHGLLTDRRPRLRSCMAVSLVALIATMQWPAWMAAGRSTEGGPQPDLPSMLDVTDAYLPQLDRGGRVLVLTAAPLKPLVQWTFLERYGRLDRLDQRWYGFGAAGAENRRGFRQWLETTDCETVIYCDPLNPKECPDAGPECPLHAELEDILKAQRLFVPILLRELPSCNCRVQVWRRAESSHAVKAFNATTIPPLSREKSSRRIFAAYPSLPPLGTHP